MIPTDIKCFACSKYTSLVTGVDAIKVTVHNPKPVLHLVTRRTMSVYVARPLSYRLIFSYF